MHAVTSSPENHHGTVLISLLKPIKAKPTCGGASWEAATGPNKHVVHDQTIPPPGFKLPHRQWTALNRLYTGQGLCGSTLHRWWMRSDALCDCGGIQTMEHITLHCPLQKLSGGFLALHQLTPKAAT